MALKIYPNGLRLSVINKDQSKLVSVCLLVTSGTQSEKNYEAGISEFVSRMLLMGTEAYPSFQSLSSFAKSNGIVLSSDNGSEGIVVNATTTSDNVDKAIDLLCDIAFNSVFDAVSGDKIRNSLLSDISKLQENPAYILERLVNQALFYRTGLANAKYGTLTTISRMTSSDAKGFWDRVLTPKNTVISVVGEVNADMLYEKVMQTFYSRFIEGGEYKKLKYVAAVEGFVGGERTKNKKLNQSRIFLSFPGPSYRNSKKYALEIIEPIILRKIAQKLEAVTYFHSELISHEFYANNGKFTIETMVDYDHVNEYLNSVVAALKELKNEKITQSDFELNKNAFIVNFLVRNDRSSDLAVLAGREVAVLKQSYSITSELLKIELLSVNDANKVLSDILNFSKLFIAYLGSSADISALNYID